MFTDTHSQAAKNTFRSSNTESEKSKPTNSRKIFESPPHIRTRIAPYKADTYWEDRASGPIAP